MTPEQRVERKRRQLEEAARVWGELVAREQLQGENCLDFDLFAIENLAAIAARGVVRGMVETIATEQATALGAEQPCPCCGQGALLDHRSRSLQVRGGEANLPEPVGRCSVCRRDFFPSASHT